MSKVRTQSYDTEIKLNTFNGKWYIQFVGKRGMLKDLFSKNEGPTYVFNKDPYVSPEGQSYWQVRYFDSAHDAAVYVRENLTVVDFGDIQDVTAQVNREPRLTSPSVEPVEA